jgi:hypothetical protein
MQTVLGILLAAVSADTHSVRKQNAAAKPMSDAPGAGAGAGSSSGSAEVTTKDRVPAPPEDIHWDIVVNRKGNMAEEGKWSMVSGPRLHRYSMHKEKDI